MSQNTPANYLVTYDIADPRRLARMFKFLKKHGLPVQYSVFLLQVNAVKMNTLMTHMAKIIDPEADDVRAYRLPENGWQATLGASILPTEILPGTLTLG